MEAIIRTENETLFKTILYFLKRLNVSVETKEKLVGREDEFFTKRKSFPLKNEENDAVLTAFASEKSLSKDWLKKEEDEAWKDL